MAKNINEKPFERVPPEVPASELTPFNVTCTSTKCEDGLHCFKLNQRLLKKYGEAGVCRNCGISLIDWNRVQKNDLNDVQYIFKSLKRELIRHVYWHTEIDPAAIEKAQALGSKDLQLHARKVLTQRIGHAENVWDGRQTPKKGDEIVNYAQHATATCCRKCLEYWHGIPMGRSLRTKELSFCTDLVMAYVQDRGIRWKKAAAKSTSRAS